MELTGLGLVSHVKSGNKLAISLPFNEPPLLEPDLLANLLSPLPPLTGAPFELDVAPGRTIVSCPVSMPKGPARGELSSFNLYFVVASNAARRSGNWHATATRVASALRHEQEERGYLEQQLALLAALREDVAPANTATAPALWVAMQARSLLARELQQLYAGLRGAGGWVDLRINGWSRLCVGAAAPVRMREQPQRSKLRPYQTLLVTRDLSELPTIASASLLRLLELCNPLKSFQDLTLLVELPLDELLRLADHCVSWGIARVVDTLTRNNVYKLSSTANRDVDFAQLDEEFAQTGSRFELCHLLAAFSAPKALGKHLDAVEKKLHRGFIDAVIWLLGRELISQVMTHIYQVADMNQSDDARLLSPFFKGEHAFSEIMWLQQLRRQELLELLSPGRGEGSLVLTSHAE